MREVRKVGGVRRSLVKHVMATLLLLYKSFHLLLLLSPSVAENQAIYCLPACCTFLQTGRLAWGTRGTTAVFISRKPSTSPGTVEMESINVLLRTWKRNWVRSRHGCRLSQSRTSFLRTNLPYSTTTSRGLVTRTLSGMLQSVTGTTIKLEMTKL
jgi:hypothetical protein